jgi:hypothetical protein
MRKRKILGLLVVFIGLGVLIVFSVYSSGILSGFGLIIIGLILSLMNRKNEV